MKKQFIILALFILIYVILSTIFDLLYRSNKIVYIGDYTKVYIKDDVIQVNNTNTDTNIEVKYYFNKEFKNGYLFSEKLDYNNTNYLKVISEDSKKVEFNDSLIAMTKNVSVNIKDIEESKATNDEINSLKNFYKTNNMDYELKELYKCIFDVDNDGVDDEVYSGISYVDEEHYLYSILIKSMDSIKLIDSSLYEIEAPSSKKISLFKFIDFNNDNKYEIVVKEDNGDDQPTYFNIYSYNNGEIDKIKEE